MSNFDLKACGVLLVRGEPIHSFLLMKHPDRWDLPKGHVELGETDMECALREMEEETGISPEDVSIDPNFRFTLHYEVQNKRTKGQVKQKKLVIYLGRLEVDREIILTEHDGYEWFNWTPPHSIQEKTIDPLLATLAEFLEQ